MAYQRRSSTDLVLQLLDGYLGSTCSEEDRTAALRYAKIELNAKKDDEVQDPNAVLYHLQRRCRSLGYNEAAIRLAEGAQRIPRPGPMLSLLGHLLGSGQRQIPEPPVEAVERNASSRADSEGVKGNRNAEHSSKTADHSARPPRLSGRQHPSGDEERTATVMVREVLYACQAVSGKYVALSPDKDGTIHINSALKVRRPERQLILKLSEIGMLFRKLQTHTETSAIPDGPVRQAFMGALRQELADFYRLLATLEAQASTPLPGKENKSPAGDSYLTLRRLTVWLGEPLVRLKWLAAVADSVAPCSGGELLAALEAAAAHGQPLVRSVLTRCLKLSATPFLAQLWSWIFQGKLQASPEAVPEFFIISDRPNIDAEEHKSMWRDAYTILERMKPSSISQESAHQILRAGKSLNFLRECCGDTEWAQHSARQDLSDAATKLQYDQMKEIARVVGKATSDIDKHVVDKMLNSFQLGAHCEAIKRYLLLGQGDFIEALMDNVGHELSKPAREISEFSMNGCLDAALRASSAQYDPQDQLNRLRIKLDSSQSNEEGWDVFTLKYTVEEPVATVLDRRAMKGYLQLFKLAWALKRSEHSLNACWVDLNAVQRQLSAFPGYVKQTGAEVYSMDKVWEDLRQCHYLRNRMALLVGSIQSYMMLEVIELGWTEFQQKLKTTEDLDGLIGAHDEYLKSLRRKLFMEEPVSNARLAASQRPDIQLELRKLLRVTLELRGRIGALSDVVGSAWNKARMWIQDAMIREAKGEWGRHEGLHPVLGVPPLDLERVHQGLQMLDGIYEESLRTFVDLLPSAGNLDLRLLLFRIEGQGQGRTTDDGSSIKSRFSEDPSTSLRKLSVG